MKYQRQFIMGRTYLTREGKPVKIIAYNEASMWPHYGCVQGDDGEGRWDEDWIDGKRCTVWVPGERLGWRYDRAGESEVGRCTGSKPGGARDLMPGAIDLPVKALGEFYVEKFRASVKERGVFLTAKNMRKQGIPISVVLSTLRLIK
jgi:hypothetical protein